MFILSNGIVSSVYHRLSLSLVSSCQLLAQRTKGSFANSRHRNDFVVLSNYTCNRALSMMPSMNVTTTAFNVHRMLFQLRPLLLPPLAPPITPISGAINTNFGEKKLRRALMCRVVFVFSIFASITSPFYSSYRNCAFP